MHPFDRRWHPIAEIGTARRYIRLTCRSSPGSSAIFRPSVRTNAISGGNAVTQAESNEAAAIAPVANDAL
jgi:hypothetical protein